MAILLEQYQRYSLTLSCEISFNSYMPFHKHKELLEMYIVVFQRLSRSRLNFDLPYVNHSYVNIRSIKSDGGSLFGEAIA